MLVVTSRYKRRGEGTERNSLKITKEVGFQRQRQGRDERVARPLRLLGRSGGPHPGDRRARELFSAGPSGHSSGQSQPQWAGQLLLLLLTHLVVFSVCAPASLPSPVQWLRGSVCRGLRPGGSRSRTHREGPCTETDHRGETDAIREGRSRCWGFRRRAKGPPRGGPVGDLAGGIGFPQRN